MSSNSSNIDADDLDVDEGAVIQSVQPSVYENLNPSIQSSTIENPSPSLHSDFLPILSDSPEPIQSTSKTLYRAPILTEPKPKFEISLEELSPIENTKPAKPKNFLKKNIEITKSKTRPAPNIDEVNISDLCLEEDRKPEAINIDERFYKYQSKVKEKVQNLAKELKDKEMENCTFKPHVKSEKQKRTSDQFVSEMMVFEKIKKDKLEVLRSQKTDLVDTEGSYHPVINQRSKEIIAKKQSSDALEPIYEKLYRSAARQVEKSPPKQPPPKPTSAKRAEPVDKILYEDALRRAAKNMEPKLPPKDSQINLKSQQVLASKFTKEFQEVLNALCIEGECIEKDLAVKLLVCLNFVRNNSEHPKYEEEKILIEKFFKIIAGDENIRVQNILKLSLAVLNIYIPSMYLGNDGEVLQYGCMVNQIFSVTKEEVLRIHKLFSHFHENRQLSNQVIKEIQATKYSFKPQINAGSEAIAKEVQKRAGSLCSQKREDFLQQERKKTQEKILNTQEQKECNI